ncbi:hypothetical protein DSAG12_03309 [Promethearchaeum syntrophicum]|uniref:FeS cluster biogenesis domain-containing protein n=1 Tax=Promethearchaeum syntrophicum TaxID=2594042 RepID=A0A5B9DEF2_9ARCH|nr:hypothetical protein [Candidatus Prometheoarchaeum syntrophicum]QEE17472.1 hypothetical protein DSAG12_03309 [Candidatus Prometheoarchaeum syntrophicum]
MYELEVSPKALDYILKKGKDEFQGIFAITIVDTTCCGGMVSVELTELDKAKKDLNLDEVFPMGTAKLPCGIWIEKQSMSDGAIPDKILIDLNPYSKNEKLELKNSAFETPYE